MECRLPTNLGTTTATGMDSIGNVPLSRWDLEGLWRGSQISKARFGGFLPDVDTFDCSLFSISVPEAELMDPQQRLLLEVGAGAPLLFCHPVLHTFYPGQILGADRMLVRELI